MDPASVGEESVFVAKLHRQQVLKRAATGAALERASSQLEIRLSAKTREEAWDELAGRIRGEAYEDTGKPNLTGVAIFDMSGQGR